MNRILSGSEFRDFWIDWGSQAGRIAVGIGKTVGEQEKISWVDPDPIEVAAVSLDTGSNADIRWQFLRDSGR